MKILIHGINFSPELVGIGKYTGEMAVWLVNNGHEVRVVTAHPYYPMWKVGSDYSFWSYTRNISMGADVWRCPLYVPSKPRALSRILHLVSFSIASLPILLWQVFWRPDIVMVVAPTLFCSPQVLLLSKLAGAKSVLHIQDFEVDALFSLGILSHAPCARLFKNLAIAFERRILMAFDCVSTISLGMQHLALKKGVEINRLRFLPNWSEVNRFINIKHSSDFLSRFGISPEKKVILYSGNMGEKQGLDVVLGAAKELSNKTDLIFLMVGEGASRSNLILLMSELGLSNVIFAPLQSYDDLPILLASVDVHLVIQRRDIADLVLPSKLGNIFSVGGNSVITADEQTSLGLLCIDNPGIAVVVEPESIESLIKGIESALLMPTPNLVAQSYAQKFLDKDKVLSNFFSSL